MPHSFFEKQILSSGGSVSKVLDDNVRGLIWLCGKNQEDQELLGTILDRHAQIGWIQLPMSGVEAFHKLMGKEGNRRRVWTSAKGCYSQPVAEHALTLSLSCLRGLNHRFQSEQWGKPGGISLYGLNVLLVGLGGIGISFLELLRPFKCNVTDLRVKRVVGTRSLHQVLPNSDVVILAAALTSETRNLFSKAEFELMKPNSVLINVARGEIIDTDRLVEVLRTNKLGGVGLDVTFPEPLPRGHVLWAMMRESAKNLGGTNLIITPHTAESPDMIGPLLAERIRSNVEAFVRQDGSFLGRVDTDKGY
ncbi:putative 2-hydroxyacid dehydrogenase [Violaceomyces palustris]|uniref:2-hydroxyacid dehydrogenase n=1 Tax=Violaceomyces palustris TaxID=1673888 RepID=A0ACD0P8K3_9BASI|nr:putative 2-hydroxyacid dehydrogenase [Violaceomyces palustris]